MKAIHPVRICVPICEDSLDAAKEASARAFDLADLIELRLDCLDTVDVRHALSEMLELLHRVGKPAIVTYRPAEQGGRRALSHERRYEFWSDMAQADQVAGGFLDLELDIVERFASQDASSLSPLDWTRVICSKHDFGGAPADLVQTYDQMARTPARILKIAVQAEDLTDCLPVFQLLDRACAEKREMIAIAMGTSGFATRILAPSRGAFLTYGALGNESATAPGQISASELRTLYRIGNISRQTQIMGLVGLPVAHSISPHMHNLALESVGCDGVYIPFEVRDSASFLRRMIHPRTREIEWNIRGLSVTAPHKSAVMSCLDWIEPAAKEIGAVNTIVVEGDELHGYNTDAPAFTNTLNARIGELRNARCAVIGAGGVASAVLWGLKQRQANVTLYARDVEKAKSLADKFGARWAALNSARFEGFDVVINATTLGTWGPQENATPATASQLGSTRLAYDLVYNPEETRFLCEARAAGCDVLGGLAMLVTQAAEQFRLWIGAEAPAEIMHDAATKALESVKMATR